MTVQEEVLPIAEPDLLAVVQAATPPKGTYGQILRSSALVGGSSAATIAIGIVRTKLMAVLLGPAGFGLLSVYGSVITLTQTLAGMGINSSGVRQIAEAASTGETQRIAETTVVLRRISILLGVLGGALLIVFSRSISVVSFGNRQHVAEIAALSVAVLFSLISAGQNALVQGMRRIGDLAKMGVLGALLGTVVSIPIVYVLRERGIVLSLTAVALMTALTSWWYGRRVRISTPSMTASSVVQEAGDLLKLGFAFMCSGLMTIGVAYVIRITILRQLGSEATGLYQSAWTLGCLYVGFILQAMGADFYPRLTAHRKDDAACNRLVNEQAQVGLLLAGPGVLGTLTFAPLVIAVFYSAKFGGAVALLRWICLGSMIQVVTWPMGFIIVARAKQALFIGCELAWTIVSLALAWVCVRAFGLNGVGIAFFGSYIFHGLLIYGVVHRMSHFGWSEENRRAGFVFFAVISIVFTSFYLLPFLAAEAVGFVATLACAIYSVRALTRLVSLDRAPAPLRRLLTALHLTASPIGRR